MEQYKRYYGIVIFLASVGILVALGVFLLTSEYTKYNNLTNSVTTKKQELDRLVEQRNRVEERKKKISESMRNIKKKIYSPAVSDLENETLFFTLCNDVIEMIQANTIKIKSIKYAYNPEGDPFVQYGKGSYFVCRLDLELISNYVNLGKLIQELYQYPYYIKINSVEVAPYPRDKKVLITKLELSLYAHTSPDEESQLPEAEQ